MNKEQIEAASAAFRAWWQQEYNEPMYCHKPDDRAEMAWLASATASEGRIAELTEALRSVLKLAEENLPTEDCEICTEAYEILNAPAALAGSATPSAVSSYPIDPPAGFVDYVRANYNGVIDIHAPDWHAKRLWNAAMKNFASSPKALQKQLIAQLHSDVKWTRVEQDAFAVFLAQFPNESSQGIISLGDAWKHGQAYANSAPQDTLKNADRPKRTKENTISDLTVAEVEALELDAARYGWLRASGEIVAGSGKGRIAIPMYAPTETHRIELDQCIDAARTAAIESERATLKEGKA